MNSRLKQLRSLMQQNSVDAVLISSVPNIIYLTEFNHFSTEEREAYLLITHNHAYILTDTRYTHAVQTHVKDFELLEISYGHGFAQWIQRIWEKEHIQTLGIEEDNLTYQEYKKIAKYISTIYHTTLTSLREIKSNAEITAIQKACAIGDKAFADVLTKLKEDMTERALARHIETFMQQHDAQPSFGTIVAFGANGAFVHHKTGNTPLQKNTCVLLDFGVKYENYCSDMSRTIFYGKASPEQKKAYQVVLDAQQQAITYIKKQLTNGEEIRGADMDKVAREYIINQGFPSFPHGLGHGIGLEVHEQPSLRPPSESVLTSGMVFSIEPGIYLPHNFGIRIEDLFVIEGKQLVQLTQSPRTCIEV